MGKLIDQAKERWRLFRESEPGLRFQNRYYRVKVRSSSFGRSFNLLGGVVLLLAGLSFAWVIFIAGLGLLSGESLVLARFFDRSELWLTRIATRSRDLWMELPPLAKASIFLVGGVVTGFGAYYLVSWWPGQG